MGLAEDLVDVHAHLERAGVPHAFGGAIALAFCTQDPRATADLDVNVFVGTDGIEAAIEALPTDVRRTSRDIERAKRDGQVRLWKVDTPVDLFFSYHPFHDQTARRVRTVPFEDVRIPVLDCTDLVVFKALFGRTRDWADIEDIAAARAADEREALAWVGSLLGRESPAYRRLAEVFA